MTVIQTIDVPKEIPAGKTLIVFKSIAETSPCMTVQEARDLGLGLDRGTAGKTRACDNH